MNHCKYICRLVGCALVILLSIDINVSAQCTITEVNGNPIEILDETSFGLKFIVRDDTNADLLGVQGICGVRIDFSHTQISDVNIELIAPDGSKVFLVGPVALDGTTPALPIFPINHNILFVPESTPAATDPNTPDPWTNLNPNWSNVSNYTGIYHPHFGSFESDFAQGPVSGIWEIRVTDQFLNDQGVINSVELIFCDAMSVNCQVCEADAGEYQGDISMCQGEILLPEEWHTTSTASMDDYTLIYSLDSAGVTVNIDQNYSFSDLPKGQYAINALSVLTENVNDLLNDLEMGIVLDSVSGLYCFDQTFSPLLLTVESPDTVNIIKPFCSGQPTIFEGEVIRNIDTMITRLLPDCSEFQIITFEGSTVNAVISLDTVILGCNNLFTRVDASGSNRGTAGDIFWFRNDQLIENETSLTLENVQNTGQFILEIDDEGCISRDTTLVIFELFAKTYDFIVDSLTCTKDTASISFALSESTFSANWSGPSIIGPSSFTESILVDQPGEYRVMGLDTAGCPYSEVIEVVMSAELPKFSVSTDSIKCGKEQATAILQSEETNLDITWVQGDITVSEFNEFSTRSTEDIQLTVMGANGCEVDTTIQIGVDTNAIVLNGRNDTLNCTTATITLRPDIIQNNASYTWMYDNITENTPSITISAPGIYTLLGSTPNGCSDSAEYIIELDTLRPLISFTQDEQVTCLVDSAVLELNITDGATVEWKYPDVQVADDPRQIVYAGGNYMVEIIQPRNNCSNTLNLEVTESTTDPVFNVNTVDISCINPIGQFDIDSDETVEVSISVNGGELMSVNQIETMDSADIFYTVKGENGCAVEGFTRINNNISFPSIDLPSTVTLDCINETATIAPEVLDVTLIDRYFINIVGDTLRVDSLVVTEPTTLLFEALSDFGCLSTESIEVVESVFSGDFEFGVEDGLYCDRSEILLDFSAIINDPNIQSTWELSGASASIFEAGTSVSLSGEGTFELTLVDASNGCSVSDTFELAITDAPFMGLDISSADESCEGLSDGMISVDNINGGTGTVDLIISGSSSGNIDLNALEPDLYSIMAVDEFGCMIDTSVIVNPGSTLDFELGDDIVLFPNEAVELDPNVVSDGMITNAEWVYNGAILDESGVILTYIPTESGLLTLYVNNEFGCELSDSILVVKAEAIEDLVYLPNVISPLSQLGNDVLIGSFSERITTINSFAVYDRWGNVMTELRDILPGQNIVLWDGTAANTEVSSGVYVYRVEVTLNNGAKEIGSGEITVLR